MLRDQLDFLRVKTECEECPSVEFAVIDGAPRASAADGIPSEATTGEPGCAEGIQLLLHVRNGLMIELEVFTFNPDLPILRLPGANELKLADPPPLGPKLIPTDTALAQNVRSLIFRDLEVHKGHVNVNAENGVVILRGVVGYSNVIRELGERALMIHGVRAVDNLLHRPGEEPPKRSRRLPAKP